MSYDIDAKIEETARELAAAKMLSLNELLELRNSSTNRFSAKVLSRAIELRTTTEELCPDTTSG